MLLKLKHSVVKNVLSLKIVKICIQYLLFCFCDPKFVLLCQEFFVKSILSYLILIRAKFLVIGQWPLYLWCRVTVSLQ